MYDPCSVCGSKDLNLIDGFYYCIECGTQDANVRETVIEESKVLSNGIVAQVTKRKILKQKDDKVQMSGEWYKWHTFNFIICGLADELIALGAEPTFKIKLLWIWTKYVKKYQSRDDLSVTINESLVPSIIQNTVDGEIDEETIENAVKSRVKSDMPIKTVRDVKKISASLLVTMLYVALNIDKSDIQISHLFRFIEEGRLNITNFERHLPEDVDVKSIPNWNYFVTSCGPRRQMGTVTCRAKAMTLFKILDLGSPVLPDMRKIVSNYVTELCLPEEFKNLVFSLMQLWPCDYLEIDVRGQSNLLEVPNYEVVAMSYVVVGLKMCFGLDDQYEFVISNAIDKINETAMYPQCHKLGFTPQPSGRLFSFREWIGYLQFRTKMLASYRICAAENEHYLDTDDYAFMEYLTDRTKGQITLTHELSMNIINQIPLENDMRIIPKKEFPLTLTPITTYIEIIAHHCKDFESIQLLCEDFSQYSLSYACESLNLTDMETNLILGVSDNKKKLKGKEILCGYLKGMTIKKRKKMIYIRNCDNKNWLKTKKPSLDHVTHHTFDDEKTNDNDRESDHGYDSNIENSSSDKETLIDVCESNELETIREEEEDRNIFDDTFVSLAISDEVFPQDDNHFDVLTEESNNDMVNQYVMDDNKSVSSECSFEFNPETFNRERAVKELILHACKKHKIPIPKEYKTSEPRKRRHEHFDDGLTKRKYLKKSDRVEVKQKINKMLEAYYKYVEKDIINQIANQVQSAIWEANQTNNLDVSIEHGSESTASHQVVTSNNIENPDASNVLLECDNTGDVEVEIENLEPTLFEDENDNAEVEDLIPKSDALFDESKYDVNQLYIKVNETNPEDIISSIQDTEIDRILKREIEDCNSKENQLGEVKADAELTDTEDELPLSVIKDEHDTYLKETEEENNYKPLIESESINEFKYWLKHYDSVYMGHNINLGEKFDTELFENTPRTFNFILKECATILGCKQFCLYKSMQNLEKRLMCFVRNVDLDESNR